MKLITAAMCVNSAEKGLDITAFAVSWVGAVGVNKSFVSSSTLNSISGKVVFVLRRKPVQGVTSIPLPEVRCNDSKCQCFQH